MCFQSLDYWTREQKLCEIVQWRFNVKNKVNENLPFLPPGNCDWITSLLIYRQKHLLRCDATMSETLCLNIKLICSATELVAFFTTLLCLCNISMAIKLPDFWYYNWKMLICAIFVALWENCQIVWKVGSWTSWVVHQCKILQTNT